MKGVTCFIRISVDCVENITPLLFISTIEMSHFLCLPVSYHRVRLDWEHLSSAQVTLCRPIV